MAREEMAAAMRRHEAAVSAKVTTSSGSIEEVPIDREHRYGVARAASTIAALDPVRVALIDAEGAVLEAVDAAPEPGDAASRAYAQAYADCERIFRSAYEGARQAQDAAIALITSATQIRAAADRDRAAAAKQLGYVQAEHARAQAERRAARAERDHGAPPEEDRQGMEATIREVVMSLIPEIASNFGIKIG